MKTHHHLVAGDPVGPTAARACDPMAARSRGPNGGRPTRSDKKPLHAPAVPCREANRHSPSRGAALPQGLAPVVRGREANRHSPPRGTALRKDLAPLLRSREPDGAGTGLMVAPLPEASA